MLSYLIHFDIVHGFIRAVSKRKMMKVRRPFNMTQRSFHFEVNGHLNRVRRILVERQFTAKKSRHTRLKKILIIELNK